MTRREAIFLGVYVLLALGVLVWAHKSNAATLELRFISTLKFVNDPLTEGYDSVTTGTGVATVGSGENGRLTYFRFDEPLNPFSLTIPLTDPNNATMITLIQVGELGGPTGSELTGLPAEVAVRGTTILCLLFANCISPFYIPLTVNGSVGIGLGGTYTVNTFANSGKRLSIEGAPWTVGPVTITIGENIYLKAEGGGVGTGTTEYGTVKPCPIGGQCGAFSVVSKVVVSDNGDIKNGIMRLTIQFIPEPVKGLLLFSGIGGLLCLGRKRIG
jgi:hypothetical protein